MMKRLRVASFAGAGHFLQEDTPDAISEAIAAWYAEDEAGLQRPDAIA